ncbi:uncharacterized protein LOC135334385 isoform X2 [Halichondria panicea]|uniref:uncharacterized protein LOC135334385 isoform X2 n=1 Tax=Halichondria panicea TaxID=6063 RepID=UPI00312B435F
MNSVLFQVFISLLLILNHFASCSRKLTANALNESCLAEGEPTFCDCQAPLQRGSMEWTGNSSTFVCPGSNTGQANLIVFALGETCSAKGQNDASCGPYFANITCNDNGYLSVLSFTANSNMNGGTILCQQNLTGAEPYQQFFIRVGVRPYPPAKANLTFPMIRNLRLDWTPPANPVIGGIRGYLLYFSPDCGTCSHSELVSNTTFTALCNEWQANGQTCVFEVRTVTEDCGLESPLLRKISIFDGTRPTNIRVSILCTVEVDPRTIHVEWSYIPPQVIHPTTLPEVQGFTLIISDNRTARRLLLPGAQVREHSFNSSFLQAANLTGNANLIWVIADTAADRIPSESILFMAADELITGIDLSQVLTEQCVQISINSFCKKSAASFQVQLRFSRGICEDNAVETTTNNYTLQTNYMTCIPTENYTNCFSVVVFNGGMEIGASDQQQLILSECNTSSITASGVWFNSTMGRVSIGHSVPHNAQLDIHCNPYCRMLVGDNNTLCVNGTFEPAGNARCDCSPDEDKLLRIYFFASIPMYICLCGMILCCCGVHIYEVFVWLFTGEFTTPRYAEYGNEEAPPSSNPTTYRPRPKQKLAGSSPNIDAHRSLKQRNLSRSRSVQSIPHMKLTPPTPDGPRPGQIRKVSGSKSVHLEVPGTNRLRPKQKTLSGSSSIQLEELSDSSSVLLEELDNLHLRQRNLSARSVLLEEVSPPNTDDSHPKLKTLSVEVEVYDTDDDPRPKEEKPPESIQLIQVAPANIDDDPRPKEEKLSESIQLAPANTNDNPCSEEETLPSESIQLKEVAPANIDDDPRPRPKQKKLSKPRPNVNTTHPKQKKLSVHRSADTDDDPRSKEEKPSESILLIQVAPANTEDDPRPKEEKLIQVAPANTDDDPRPEEETLPSESLKKVAPAITEDDPRSKEEKPSESIQLIQVAPANTEDDPRPKEEKPSESILLIQVAPANTEDDPHPKEEKLIQVAPANTDDDPRPEEDTLPSESLKEVAPAITEDDPRSKEEKPSESIQLKEVAPANTDDDPRPRPKQKKLSKPRPKTDRPKQKKL